VKQNKTSLKKQVKDPGGHAQTVGRNLTLHLTSPAKRTPVGKTKTTWEYNRFITWLGIQIQQQMLVLAQCLALSWFSSTSWVTSITATTTCSQQITPGKD